MVDHQLSQLLTVYQNNLLLNPIDILHGVWRKSRSSDQYTLPCPMSLKTTGKSLDNGPSNRRIPPLRLNANGVQSQPIFLDNPINPIIAASANRLSSISSRTTVTHSN